MNDVIESVIEDAAQAYGGNMPVHNRSVCRDLITRRLAKAQENPSGLIAQSLYIEYGIGDWTPADVGEAPYSR